MKWDTKLSPPLITLSRTGEALEWKSMFKASSFLQLRSLCWSSEHWAKNCHLLYMMKNVCAKRAHLFKVSPLSVFLGRHWDHSCTRLSPLVFADHKQSKTGHDQEKSKKRKEMWQGERVGRRQRVERSDEDEKKKEKSGEEREEEKYR